MWTSTFKERNGIPDAAGNVKISAGELKEILESKPDPKMLQPYLVTPYWGL